MKSQPSFRTPYPRPRELRDPEGHFNATELRKLLRKSDLELAFDDFRKLFHFGTLPGTPVQVAYFLPFAFELLRTSPDNGIEYVDGLICFLSNHRELLEKDGVLPDCEAAVLACCKAWTETFQVRHYGKEACQEKGWQLSSFDVVDNNEIFVSLLDSLWRYDVFAELANGFVSHLARTGANTVETCWFLEFARAVRKRIAQTEQPALTAQSVFGFEIAAFSITPVMRSEQVVKLIQDKELLRQKYGSIGSTEVVRRNPSYWTTVAETLQLGDVAAGN